MKQITRIYVVTNGDYSDYHVCCICSTKEKAERAKLLYKASNKYYEVILDDFKNIPEGLLPFKVIMDKEGNSETEEVSISCFGNGDVFKYYDETNTPKIGFNVFAKDEKHAVKIANEKRIQLIANNDWEKIK